MKLFFAKLVLRSVVGAVALTAIALALSSCSSLERLDRNRLSHPAMDFNSRNTPKPSKAFVNMAVDEGSGGGGCAVCAH